MARTTPRISANKLAEYLEATSARRKKIVYDCKNPQGFIVTRYKDARGIICDYLTSHITDDDFVLAGIDAIEAKPLGTDFQEQDKKLSIESLESLLETDLSALNGSEITVCKEDNKLVVIKGVEVSVNPDLMTTKVGPDGVVCIGAIKLHLSKTNMLTEEGQKIVAILVNNYLVSEIVQPGQIAHPKHSFSFDLFQQKLICSPTSQKLRMKNIEAACEEIALWWDTV